MGRVSLQAALLFHLMWINCDDQGRISGDPDEIKYAVCPNIDHISKADIPQLLKELGEQRFITLYATSKTAAIQMLDWWEEQRLQWAYPSQYPPAEGWIDHLRYHPNPKEIISENWPPTALGSVLPNPLGSVLPSTSAPPNPPLKKEIRNRNRNRILPSVLGSTVTSTDVEATLKKQTESLVPEILTYMRTFFGYPESAKTDPIPAYGREGQAIKRMLTRGFTREEILTCWRNKVTQRGGEFVSMTWVNQDIGKITTAGAGGVLYGTRKNKSGTEAHKGGYRQLPDSEELRRQLDAHS